MLSFRDPKGIIKLSDVDPKYQKNLIGFFKENQDILIVETAPGQYCTLVSLLSSKPSADIRVKCDDNVFKNSYPFVYHYRYAIAVNENNEPVHIVEYLFSTYGHFYEYSGGLDMWFLDSFGCLILHDCNEFSVELCKTALRLWKGKRLVLVGGSWAEVIPFLPDLPGVESFWEDELTDERFADLRGDLVSLNIIHGIPHNEPISRFNSGVAYYDEVMPFTYLFSNLTHPGEDHPDKEFCIINSDYSFLGLLTVYSKAADIARYVKAKGYIPLIRLSNTDSSIYSTDPDTDVWNMFFCQPEGYTLEDIKSSKNVIIAPPVYNGSVLSNLMGRFNNEVKLTWPDGLYNSRVTQYLKEKEEKFLPYPESTLGVLVRGTDYAKGNFQNHPKHATPEMVAEKIDEIWDQWGGLSYIFLATEDKEYCDYFAKRYEGRIFFTDQRRFSTENNGESLTDALNRDPDRDGFLLGADYLLSIELLAKCRSFIASGGCTGVYQVRAQNAGKYEHEYVFELGFNK